MRIRVLTAVLLGLLGSLGWAQTSPARLHADRVVVLKKERTLQLLYQGKVIKTYKVALGGDPVGPKTRQSDHKTPEGVYVLDSRNPPQPVLQVNSYLVSKPKRPCDGAAEGRLARRRCVRTWIAERLSLCGSGPPPERLDRWMHRSHRRRDGRDLAGGSRWNAD